VRTIFDLSAENAKIRTAWRTAVQAVRTLSMQGELTGMVVTIKQILELRGED